MNVQAPSSRISSFNNHPLHVDVASHLKSLCLNRTDLTLLIDQACGGSTRLPFFMKNDKSRSTIITNPDIIILKKVSNGELRVRFVCEIEESDVKPIKLYGKFASLISTCMLQIKDQIYPFDDDIIFLQVVSSRKLKPNSKKKEQWSNIENSIRAYHSKNSKFRSISYYLAHDCNYQTLLGEISI